jgi:hypothetical protein
MRRGVWIAAREVLMKMATKMATKMAGEVQEGAGEVQEGEGEVQEGAGELLRHPCSCLRVRVAMEAAKVVIVTVRVAMGPKEIIVTVALAVRRVCAFSCCSCSLLTKP